MSLQSLELGVFSSMASKTKHTYLHNYPFEIKFVPNDYELIKGYDGRTFYNKRLILMRDDLDDVMTKAVLRHELTHAILMVQGRGYQKKFDVEELCEFVAFQSPIIEQKIKEIMGE